MGAAREGRVLHLPVLRASTRVRTPRAPRTHHVTTHITVDVDDEAGTAAARSYVTVFQALPDFPPQPVAAGRYRDRFARRDEQWRFTERQVRIHLVGDVSRHLRA
ncbi:nuclear transport factor 2 family protein [Streptomyces sp. NPDC005803]|uniref:nuclear transport factor 2 family protein n=1 Tax=Streptomyces sp. NPDC005803 TaxID=3154297 RepID=UPI0033E21B3D